MELKKPTKCHLWQKENLTPSDLDFELVKIITESSHFVRNILRCKQCGQLYFHEFYEHINFGGDDDMYDTWIPVYDEEDIKIVSEAKTPIDLLQFSPRLHWAFTNGKEEPIQWIGK